MSATLVSIQEERKQGTMSTNWQTTSASRHFYVLYDYIETGQQMAAWEEIKDYLVEEDGGNNLLNWGNGVPYFPGYPRLPISNISVTQEGMEPKWLVHVTYEAASISHIQGAMWQGMAGSFPPWWLPWNINTSFSPVSFTPVKGGILSVHRYESGVYASLFSGDPRTFMTRSSRVQQGNVLDDNGFGWQEQCMNPIVNSAGELFDNPPEEELFLMTLSLSGARNPESYPLDGATLMPYLGCINAEPIIIAGNWFDWGYLRIKNASIATNNWNGQLYQDISIELEANPLSWKHTVLDRGSVIKTPVEEDEGKIPMLTGYPVQITDLDGNLMEWEDATAKTSEDETRAEEVFLNGYGSVRGYNYSTKEKHPELEQTHTPTVVDWVTKPFVYFSDLGLPTRSDGVL